MEDREGQGPQHWLMGVVKDKDLNIDLWGMEKGKDPNIDWWG